MPVRVAFWNCNMALHRKMEALMALRPDIAVISECAEPETLAARGGPELGEGSCVWMGRNRHKGLGVFAFGGYRLRRHEPFHPGLSYILPVNVSGPVAFNLLAVWAQNASGGVTRKHQLGPFRRSLPRYQGFITGAPCLIGGDFNNNRIWDRPGWRMNHMAKMARLDALGFVSVYHAMTGEGQGAETTPTHYWRDRTKDGPTYHIDYIFAPVDRVPGISHFSVGTFEDWCGNKLSDHVPLVIEIDMAPRG
ncbi:endonuclease/exonuclease/phosphatase family protein [Rhodobacteraceae bacterium NNCM2]|nr:endonuclease/exonuclease/phosphatase family protein [Coraliihabitans acroporae]